MFNGGFTNSSSATSFDFESMKKTMAEISEKMQKLPTAFVMTTTTFQAVKERFGEDASAEKVDAVGFGSLPLFTGTPVEDYPTVRECMNRMANQQPGERLQLVLDGPVPLDCLSHPWMKRQAEAFAEKYRSEMMDRMRQPVFGSPGFRCRAAFGGQ